MFVETVFHWQSYPACEEINTLPGACANTNARERVNDVTKAASLFAPKAFGGNALNGKRISGQKGNRLFSSANGLNNKPIYGQKGNLLLPGALLVTMQTQLLAPFVSVNFSLAAFFK
jgi:hypothetical protein